MPYSNALIGGVLIGISTVITLLVLGRISGITSIVWFALHQIRESAWRWSFLIGLVAGPVLYHALSGAPAPAPNPAPWGLAVVAGLLVGYGSSLGSGCTSGHGVCGLGRLSLRSLIATMTFMAAGIFTVYILRHLVGGVA